jgi:phosphonate transport system permease protein
VSTQSDSIAERLRTYLGIGDIGDTAVEQRLSELKRTKTVRRIWMSLGLVGFIIAMNVALTRVGFSIPELVAYFPEFLQALGEYFPSVTYFGILPFVDFGRYWTFIRAEGLFQLAIVTLAMGFAGTVLGAPGALVLGVLGSERVIPYPFNFVFRGTMTVIRAIPALVWALIFIPLGGVSPFTGTLAIATDTVGDLGRLFTDELEEVEAGPIEGIESTGTDKPQVIMFGMLSQVFRPFIAWTMYMFEINVRTAVSLGIIGAGGLGYMLQIQRQTFQYTNMMAAILVVVILVLTVEIISQRIRAYIRTDDDESRSILQLIARLPERLARSAWR